MPEVGSDWRAMVRRERELLRLTQAQLGRAASLPAPRAARYPAASGPRPAPDHRTGPAPTQGFRPASPEERVPIGRGRDVGVEDRA